MPNSTLQQAVAAELPLIAVSTKDRANANAVVYELTGKEPLILPPGKGLPQVSGGQLYQVGAKNLENRGYSYSELYAVFMKAHASLVVYNLQTVPPEFFDAGVLPIPANLVFNLLAKAEGVDKARGLLPAFGGLTLKEVAEVYRLTKVRDGQVSARGVASTRKGLFQPGQGLQLVDTQVHLYWPQEDLLAYSENPNAWFFLHDDKNPRLRPRGLLLEGDPGAGKTTFAKWLANMWGVPLFRLNVGFHNKYVGESARLFAALLDQIEQQAPCIVLWDEVEKMFAGDDASTQQVMSLALWWLAEHRARVLTVMTCNNMSKLPPELYRPGRVDAVMKVAADLEYPQGLKFALALTDTFDFDPEQVDPYDAVQVAVQELYGRSEQKVLTHGQVVQAVVNAMKEMLLGA